jgi:hypothetical protein
MSTLLSTPDRRSTTSHTPRASLSIHVDAPRDGAIPLAQLAEIARHTQDALDRIARALHDRGTARQSPNELTRLSALKAVTTHDGTATLKIEAPNGTEQFPINFAEAGSGVQAVQLFVEAIDAHSRGDEPPARIAGLAQRSLRDFIAAVKNHEHVRVEAKVGGDTTKASFVPNLIVDPAEKLPDTGLTGETVEIVGTLYGVNLEKHTYRIRDELGKTRYVSLREDLDGREMPRTLLGGTVRVTGVPVDRGDGAANHYEAISIELAASPGTSEYYTWNLADALQSVEPIESIADLRIPGLTDDEADEFRHAVND